PEQFAAANQSGAVELYHARYEQVLASGLSAVVEQRIFQIGDAETADLFVPDDLWYDSSRNHFQLVQADIVRGATTLAGRDLGDMRADATGNQPRRIGLPRLHAGDRVNLVYELLPDSSHDWSVLAGHYLGNLFAFRDSYPTEHVRYVVASADGLHYSSVGVAAPRRGVGPDGLRTWEWDGEQQTAFFSQASGPSITDRSPFVQVSGFSSWGEMANWYSNLLARQARLQPPLERTMLAGYPSREPAQATVERVWRSLAPRLRYLGDESGVHAYVPNRVAAVYRAGRGDCKDGALLLTTWLRAQGIEAYVALVRTPSMGQLAPPNRDGGAATMAAFDHAIVYVPATRQWIDTTAPDLLGGELPASDQGGWALIVRAGQQGLVRIPTAPANANVTRRTVRLTPAPGGGWRAEGTLEVEGADAPGMRERYSDPSQRAGELRNWLRLYFPNATVETVEAEGVTPASDTVRLRFTANLGVGSAFSTAWIQRHYASLMAAQEQRSDSLRLPMRWRTEEAWSLQLPAGQTCSAAPLALATSQPIDDVSPFGALHIATSCSDGWFSAYSVVTQAADEILPGTYPGFRAFWQSVDARLDAPLTSEAAVKAITTQLQ
ncbi:MAG TPA: hypothetical protein VIC32_09300, partial [Terriglobales bacterium]